MDDRRGKIGERGGRANFAPVLCHPAAAANGRETPCHHHLLLTFFTVCSVQCALCSVQSVCNSLQCAVFSVDRSGPGGGV